MVVLWMYPCTVNVGGLCAPDVAVSCITVSNLAGHSNAPTDNTQTGSTHCLHLFGTYDVAYAQFRQDPLGSLKMALLKRRNMSEQD
jgi:hypothetical protein